MNMDEPDRFAALRERMVEEQLIRRGIRDEKVLRVFRELPRHRFVSSQLVDSAYADHPLPIGDNQTISQPYIVALMTQELDLEGCEKVLELGTGSGYQTAILASLAGQVYSIERFPDLAGGARRILGELGITNVVIRCGDGTLGWPEAAPFERIMVTAAAPDPPPPLVEQLRDGGKMVIPLGGTFSQALSVIEKGKGKLKTRDVCGCVFVPLVGEFGWKNEND